MMSSDTPAAWLSTPQLALREFAAGDAPDVARLHADPRVRENLVDDYALQEPMLAELFVQRIAQFYRQHPGLGIWHAARTAVPGAASFAGWFSLMPMMANPSAVELGSRLLPAAWGSGAAMDGGEALLGHAFDRLCVPCVWGVCDPLNRSARLCLAALGFQECGIAPYDGRPALHCRVQAAAWRDLRHLPRRSRLRQAARTGRQYDDSREIQHAAAAP